MKTPKEWMQIHGENSFYANGVLSESDIEEIQLDACQSQAERILELIAKRGIDVSDCDGDDELALILANWVVGRIEQLQEENRELEKRYKKLAQRYDQLQNSF